MMPVRSMALRCDAADLWRGAAPNALKEFGATSSQDAGDGPLGIAVLSRATGLFVLTVVLMASFAQPAAACQFVHFDRTWVDAPISVAPDCSFSGAEDHQWRSLRGGPAVDLGGEAVGQRIEFFSCSITESLLVVDCQNREMISIFGEPVHPAGVVPNHYSVDLLYPPGGAIQLTSETTVGQLVVISEAEGYSYHTNVLDRLNRMEPHNRYDPYCGCRLFYPESAGAQ